MYMYTHVNEKERNEELLPGEVSEMKTVKNISLIMVGFEEFVSS